MISLKCIVGCLEKTSLGYKCSVNECPYGKLVYLTNDKLSPDEAIPICGTNGYIDLFDIFKEDVRKIVEEETRELQNPLLS